MSTTLPGEKADARGSKLEMFAQVMGRFVPDAITASVILLLILTGMALAMGNSAGKTMDAYYQGLWMLLPFTMQMTLIIVLSSVLGATPFFRTAITRLSRLPKTQFQAIALSVLVTAVAAYLYSAGRGALCSRGRTQGHQTRLSVPVGVAMGSQRGLAIRPVRQRASADGNTRSLPGEDHRHPPFEHDDLVAGRANT